MSLKISTLLNENLTIITEMVVNNPNLQKQIDEFAENAQQLYGLDKQIGQLNQQYKGIMGEIAPEIQSAKDNCVATQNQLVFLKTHGFDADSIAFAEAVGWLLSRVNPALNSIVTHAGEAIKRISKMMPKIPKQDTKHQNVNEDTGDIYIFKSIKTIFKRILPYLRHENQMIKSANSQFEKAISKLK